MHGLVIVCEYLAGALVALVTLICILVGLVIGLFEIPRYLHIRSL